MKIPYLLLFSIALSQTLTAQKPLLSPFGTATHQTGFLKNAGQVRDFNNKPVEFVYFQAAIGGQQVFITNYGLSLLLSRPKKITRIAGLQRSKTPPQQATPADSLSIVNYEMERIDIVLKNASIIPGNIVTKTAPESPQFNLYFDTYETSGQGLRLQNEVLVKNVYPGIDWKVYIRKEKGGQATLKYDFIIHPGADPSLIQLRYSDNAQLALSGAEIKATAKMGLIKEEKPYSYLQENNTEVDVTYRVKKNGISFHINGYDKSQTLVIDPSLFWLTYLSSTDQTIYFLSIFGNDVETDAAGNIFVQMSASANTPFPTKNPGGGAYYQDYTAAPNGSMIISKFAPGGQLLWSTYFGNGTGGWLMTIDTFGNIIALGMQLDDDHNAPNPNPTIPLLDNGGYYDEAKKRYFIAKFSNAGALIWCSYYLNFSSYPTDMSYDTRGNVYVVGWSEVWDFPVADPGGGAYVVNRAQSGPGAPLFIAQFNAANHLPWSTRIEASNFDPYARVCTDKLGNIYIGGHARSADYPLVDAGGYYDATSTGAVITRFNPARQMTWSTYVPGAFVLDDITVDDSSNLYVAIGRRILKFNSKTELVFEKSVTTTQEHFWKKINYDPVLDQIQLLGIMNDAYPGFPTINTACNGSFFNDGVSPNTYSIFNATGPIFATINRDGAFSYRSLADWGVENYQYNEMAIDPQGNPVYLFGHNKNASTLTNPQLTNPGNGAYFDGSCCYNSNATSALLLKLLSSELSVNTQVTPSTGCACNGTVALTPQCGKAPFTYTWSNGATTASASGLCPGDYWVRVKDANALSQIVYVTIPHPPGSISAFTAQSIPENCNRSNGAITIQSVQGGTLPYTYSLDGISYSVSSRFVGLDSGSHIVRVRDANGCIYTDTILVSRIQGPTAVSYNVLKSTCTADDGQLQITKVQGGVGPYHYSLAGSGTNSTGVFTNLAAASYQLHVSDAGGCRFLSTILIDKATPPTDVSLNTGNDHCNQGIGFIKADRVTGGAGPYTFSVDSVSFVAGPLTNLDADSYTLFVKDANGCVLKKEPVVVGHDAGPAAVDFTITQAYCGKATGDVKINAVQGGASPYLYAIDNGNYGTSKMFTGIQPGSRQLHVKDAYGCGHAQPLRVEYKLVAKINLLPADTMVCYGETLSLTLTGDVNPLSSVNWNIPAQGSSARLKASEAKKIVVTVTDRNACIIKDTSIVRVKACNPPEGCIVVPTAFTPNNDSKNETIGPIAHGCRIESISFRIYNRWGELVFETDKPGTGWNGVYKSVPQPAGAYVFSCTYVGEDGISRQLKGNFILIR